MLGSFQSFTSKSDVCLSHGQKQVVYLARTHIALDCFEGAAWRPKAFASLACWCEGRECPSLVLGMNRFGSLKQANTNRGWFFLAHSISQYPAYRTKLMGWKGHLFAGVTGKLSLCKHSYIAASVIFVWVGAGRWVFVTSTYSAREFVAWANKPRKRDGCVLFRGSPISWF